MSVIVRGVTPNFLSDDNLAVTSLILKCGIQHLYYVLSFRIWTTIYIYVLNFVNFLGFVHLRLQVF